MHSLRCEYEQLHKQEFIVTELQKNDTIRTGHELSAEEKQLSESQKSALCTKKDRKLCEKIRKKLLTNDDIDGIIIERVWAKSACALR